MLKHIDPLERIYKKKLSHSPHWDLRTLHRVKSADWLGTKSLKLGAKAGTLLRIPDSPDEGIENPGTPFHGFKVLKARECASARQPTAAAQPSPGFFSAQMYPDKSA